MNLKRHFFAIIVSIFAFSGCGRGPQFQSSSLSNNGREVDPTNSPSVLLITKPYQKNRLSSCSGALVRMQPSPAVLTAGHCLRSTVSGYNHEDVFVRIGDAIFISKSFKYHPLAFEAQGVPSWDARYDVGVIKLNPISEIRTVYEFGQKTPGVGDPIKITGYGIKSDDEDGDLVEYRVDRCPETPVGSQVDSDGCAIDANGTRLEMPNSLVRSHSVLREGTNRINQIDQSFIHITGSHRPVAPDGEVLTFPGDSGSPVLDSEGKIISVTVSGYPLGDRQSLRIDNPVVREFIDNELAQP